ncbi:hypothetical protein Tco_1175291 [Tanacetum coccineum]
MTQSQLRIYMSNYLKNQGTWKLSQLKKLKFKEIKEEFDKFDDKDVPAIGDKVAKVKEEEPVKRTGKKKKQKARKAIPLQQKMVVGGIYENGEVHCLTLEASNYNIMLADRKLPLSKKKLAGDAENEASEGKMNEVLLHKHL